NRAARIEGKAEPGHVLVSFTVYDCAVGWLRSPSIAWTHHGQVSLRGFADPVSLHEPFEAAVASPQSEMVADEASLLDSIQDRARSRSEPPTPDFSVPFAKLRRPQGTRATLSYGYGAPMSSVSLVDDPTIERLLPAIPVLLKERRAGQGTVMRYLGRDRHRKEP